MLEELKQEVWAANLELHHRGIVLYTWGNVSGVDRSHQAIVIKPSGVSYEKMTPDDMVVLDLCTGKKKEGRWKSSSDTPTHLELYRAFPELGGVVHTHSIHAVAFAQAGKDIVALGTTHADYFYGSIPCTRTLTKLEVEKDYEKNTGKVIVETIRQRGYAPLNIPGIIVRNHGPFTWGASAQEAVYHAVVLETVAEMNFKTLMLNSESFMEQYMLDKHYFRKHGSQAYYGQ